MESHTQYSAMDLGELKELVLLHAGAQGIKPELVAGILDGVERADGAFPTSWASRWMEAGAAAESRGDFDLAVKLHNLGRFPYVDGDARQSAHQRCLGAFRAWCANGPAPIASLQLTWEGHHFVTYVRRCMRPRAPLLLVFGGIVSIKEQWGLFLALADKLQVDVAVTELPGVGENTIPLTRDSHGMIKVILDALNVGEQTGCHIVAMSFGGTLALRHAVRDSRIKGLTTVGAPVSCFYCDAEWWNRIPSTTRITLTKILGCEQTETFGKIGELKLTASELAAIRIPVYYVQSLRDEIIQCKETDDLQKIAGRQHLLRIDDVHGAPRHLRIVRLFVAYSIMNTLFAGSTRAKLLRAFAHVATRFSRAKLQVFTPATGDYINMNHSLHTEIEVSRKA
ncbi:MAG: alpha/beta hydrolase [Burkholderiales bacterium]|nr:alpha/beta hydrolase [Anaerolineae bacterium]